MILEHDNLLVRKDMDVFT